MAAYQYSYAIGAAELLEQCLYELPLVIDAFHRNKNRRIPGLRGNGATRTLGKTATRCILEDLESSLQKTRGLLSDFFRKIIAEERIACAKGNSSETKLQELIDESEVLSPSPSSLLDAVDLLTIVLETKRNNQLRNARSKTHFRNPQESYAERNPTDSLLFRLIVALDLCLVRIDDASLVVTGKRHCQRGTKRAKGREVQRRCEQVEEPNRDTTGHHNGPLSVSLTTGTFAGLFGYYYYRFHTFSGKLQGGHVSGRRGVFQDPGYLFDGRSALSTIACAGALCLSAGWLRIKWNDFWMSAKIGKSKRSIDEWNDQWTMVQSTTSSHADLLDADSFANQVALHTKQSQKLVDYAAREQPKFSLLQSQGELRFLMLKRAMDVFYASVGAAMGVTKNQGEPDWQLTLATAAASSFYSLTGASRKAAEVTSSSKTAGDLIQKAWGMVSRPAIKNLSLQVSRILKNAAVADRIEISGVSCFVLSVDPAPELTAAIDSFQKKYGQKAVRTLSTIDEQEEHAPAMKHTTKPFARSSLSVHRQRDVILHLTGGGFFAHIIASDLPYLLDWSAATGSVVICPEYGLLPQHTFPDPLEQVCDVYQSLVNGDLVSILGFEVNRIVVTGESTGGNLAAALCVKLSLDEACNNDNGRTHLSENGPTNENQASVIYPDALMLSCPVLNLSLELSHSRVLGTDDPVLPRGLISAISDAYLPPRLGVSKKNPLASPLFASDSMLSRFPPTLLIASSKDPLLDDSVAFNQRLRSNGIESDLRAADNLPHAYLGLGTAGFPEAVQVQKECVEWLSMQLSKERNG